MEKLVAADLKRRHLHAPCRMLEGRAIRGLGRKRPATIRCSRIVAGRTSASSAFSVAVERRGRPEGIPGRRLAGAAHLLRRHAQTKSAAPAN